MQYLLHIDTSTDTGTVALSADGGLLNYKVNRETRNHAGTVNNMISDVLAEAGLILKDLSAVAVCAGPGSYTGLRIGMATAKGLCYALDRPLILDNKLALLAFQSYQEKNISASQYVTLLNAREKEYFIAIYDKELNCSCEPQHIVEAQLYTLIEKKPNTAFITDVAENVINSLEINNSIIDSSTDINPKAWVYYAFKEFKCNQIVSLASAEPFYLKQVYTHK